MYTLVCICPSLAPRLGGAYTYVVAARFPSEGTLQVDRRLLNYASTDLYKGFAQHLQEDAGRDSAWEASPTKCWKKATRNSVGFVDDLLFVYHIYCLFFA